MDLSSFGIMANRYNISVEITYYVNLTNITKETNTVHIKADQYELRNTNDRMKQTSMN